MTSVTQLSLNFDEIAQPSSSSATNGTATQQPELQLKRRIQTTGEKHGKAFGNIGVVTTAYTKGFSSGFLSAFKD